MGCTAEAVIALQKAKVNFAPVKLPIRRCGHFRLEMSQNSMKLSWSAKEVDEKLHGIMNNIHDNCVKYGKEKNGYINYVKVANIAGFIKVAEA
jgi:glutamate dehydrogenase (NADP+)